VCSSFRRSTVAGAPPDVGNPPPRALLGAIDRFVAAKTVPRCAGLDSKAQVDAASLWELVQRIGGTAHELGEFGEKEEPNGVYSSIGRSTTAGAPPDGGKPPPRAMFSAVDKSAASQIVIRCAGLDPKVQVDAAASWPICTKRRRDRAWVGVSVEIEVQTGMCSSIERSTSAGAPPDGGAHLRNLMRSPAGGRDANSLTMSREGRKRESQLGALAWPPMLEGSRKEPNARFHVGGFPVFGGAYPDVLLRREERKRDCSSKTRTPPLSPCGVSHVPPRPASPCAS